MQIVRQIDFMGAFLSIGGVTLFLVGLQVRAFHAVFAKLAEMIGCRLADINFPGLTGKCLVRSLLVSSCYSLRSRRGKFTERPNQWYQDKYLKVNESWHWH